jgi:hypothetical protein
MVPPHPAFVIQSLFLYLEPNSLEMLWGTFWWWPSGRIAVKFQKLPRKVQNFEIFILVLPKRRWNVLWSRTSSRSSVLPFCSSHFWNFHSDGPCFLQARGSELCTTGAHLCCNNWTIVYGQIFPIYHPNAVVSSNPYKKMCLVLSLLSSLFWSPHKAALEVRV